MRTNRWVAERSGGARTGAGPVGRTVLGVATSLAVVLATLVVPGSAAPAAAAEQEYTITGHGYGHGRGMGQWGAYGYATAQGWTHQQILARFYGGTTQATDAGSPVVDVALLSRGADALRATGPGLAVQGVAVGAAAVKVTRVGTARFRVDRAPSCTDNWAVLRYVDATEVSVSTSGSQADPATHVGACEASQVRGYRGVLVIKDVAGTAATVNRVDVQSYLRGVLPREVPAGWGSAPNGMAALRAQAVAARSYALSSMYRAWAHTCDTTTCQVYGGSWTRPHTGSTRTSQDHPLTDQAVAETAGQVRRWPDRRIVRTEFSASTGGWSAGGAFPAVSDAGDAVPANPNHDWRVTMTASQLGSALGLTGVTSLTVTSRNGYGEWGGRVLSADARSSSGVTRYTGDQLRSRLGLRSTWFTVSSVSPAASQAFVRAAYVDLLRREPDAAGLGGWTTALVDGMPRSQVAGALVLSEEHVRRVVDGIYQDALGRSAGAADGADWVRALQGGASYDGVAAQVYASPESYQRLGGGSLEGWVAGMYQAVLGRAPEAGAVQYWTEVARTRGRYQAAVLILTSREAMTIRIRGYYQDLLGRPVDPGGLEGWLGYLAGGRDLALMTALVASTEYYQRAQARYPA